ncbi:DNA-binding transcriptional MerR regulator [Aquimarina sp. EL_43]|uniref:hypothetical protein n=1 Tax=unclassified Aquimarina TaxID=2627091 RepID=UPI0018C95980|nr:MULTISPECIES: hypothetical protein [unclassified Aquimarina]MBG6129952.1 DNA-binding transcriptional MerR regulator [Aquimarina sp. EL_35]MBG6148732.1 DNA-binding transcriptional MerR regulator [Aquimarina sp. EL_32]MBG6168894.1 DNA-binding transcriptional MerR regulator [Aquimarina sp. EL_43]
MKPNNMIHYLVILGLILMLFSGYLIHLGTKKSADNRAKNIIDNITLSKDQVLEQINLLDPVSKAEIITILTPEFKKIKKEIGYSVKEIKMHFNQLSKENKKEFYHTISPQFKDLKKEVNISNDQLFERIKLLDKDSKNRILKILRPKLELIPSKTQIIKESDGLTKTTFRFEVPTNYDVPQTDILIRFNKVISKAEMWRKDQNRNTMIETRFQIKSNTDGLIHKIFNLAMNQYIILEVWSDSNLEIIELAIK